MRSIWAPHFLQTSNKKVQQAAAGSTCTFGLPSAQRRAQRQPCVNATPFSIMLSHIDLEGVTTWFCWEHASKTPTRGSHQCLWTLYKEILLAASPLGVRWCVDRRAETPNKPEPPWDNDVKIHNRVQLWFNSTWLTVTFECELVRKFAPNNAPLECFLSVLQNVITCFIALYLIESHECISWRTTKTSSN